MPWLTHKRVEEHIVSNSLAICDLFTLLKRQERNHFAFKTDNYPTMLGVVGQQPTTPNIVGC